MGIIHVAGRGGGAEEGHPRSEDKPARRNGETSATGPPEADYPEIKYCVPEIIC